MEAIACNALKKFAVHGDVISRKPFLLLNNRKVLTKDKTKVKDSAYRSGSALVRTLLQPFNEPLKFSLSLSSPAGKPRST